MRRREFITLVGGAVAWPHAVLAQQLGKVHRIALVHPSAPVAELTETGADPDWRVFFEELRRLGYIEGQNLVVERYSGGGRTEHYAELVAEVVRGNPDLIIAVTPPLVRRFKEATATIPIVGFTADPVTAGIVTSLARPGGNVTGVSVDAGFEIWGKRLEVLREVIPRASRVGFLAIRFSWEGNQGQALREAARRTGIALLGPPLDDPVQPPEYRRVFAAMVEQRAEALIVSDFAANFTYRQLIVELAEANRLPAIYPYRDHAELGGLMAYATATHDLMRHAANQVHRVLRGEKPGEIPYYQASIFVLIINMRTAKALGITVPPSILARADEVIE